MAVRGEASCVSVLSSLRRLISNHLVETRGQSHRVLSAVSQDWGGLNKSAELILDPAIVFGLAAWRRDIVFSGIRAVMDFCHSSLWSGCSVLRLPVSPPRAQRRKDEKVHNNGLTFGFLRSNLFVSETCPYKCCPRQNQITLSGGAGF